MSFRRELAGLLNQYNQERGSDTPDFILAEYLEGCLEVFDRCTRQRMDHYNSAKIETSPGYNDPGPHTDRVIPVARH